MVEGRQSVYVHIESCRAYSVVSQARRLKRLIQNKLPYSKVDINKRCVDKQPREGVFEIVTNGDVLFSLQNLAPPYTWFVREFDMEELADDIVQALTDEGGESPTEGDYQLMLAQRESRPTPYLCMYCGRDFLSADILRIHMRVHSHFKSFKCQICFKAFCYNLVLQAHLRSHALCKPFRCDFCGKLFVSADDLSTHLRTHTIDRKYKCELCGKPFNQFGMKRAHYLTHKGHYPFMCEVCGRTFPRIVEYEFHHRECRRWSSSAHYYTSS